MKLYSLIPLSLAMHLLVMNSTGTVVAIAAPTILSSVKDYLENLIVEVQENLRGAAAYATGDHLLYEQYSRAQGIPSGKLARDIDYVFVV